MEKISLYYLSFPLLLGIGISAALLVLYLMTTRDAYVMGATGQKETKVYDVDLLMNSLIWGACIPIFDLIYTKIADKITKAENYEKPSTHNKTFTLRVFSLRFINSYIALYYYALADLDLTRLSMSVFGIMLAGQLFNYVLTFFVPLFHRKRNVNKYNKIKYTKKVNFQVLDIARKNNMNTLARYSHQQHHYHEKNINHIELSQAWEEYLRYEFNNFDDFAQIVLQFGFVTFFLWLFHLHHYVLLLII